MPSVSILIPVQNEVDNVAAVIAEITAGCAALNDYEGDYEIVVTDDGSTDGTRDALVRLAAHTPRLRLLWHDRPAGQSAALHSAAVAARGAIVCTMDGDGQNPAHELVALCRPLSADTDGRIGLVAGQRVGRQDALAKRAASWLANTVRARVLGDGMRDTGCGLKAFRRDAFLALPYFDHMHRYYPALIRRDGWEIRLVDVCHRPRHAGRSKYGNFGRALSGAVDLLGVLWLIRRRKRGGATACNAAAETGEGRSNEAAAAAVEAAE